MLQYRAVPISKVASVALAELFEVLPAHTAFTLPPGYAAMRLGVVMRLLGRRVACQRWLAVVLASRHLFPLPCLNFRTVGLHISMQRTANWRQMQAIVLGAEQGSINLKFRPLAAESEAPRVCFC